MAEQMRRLYEEERQRQGRQPSTARSKAPQNLAPPPLPGNRTENRPDPRISFKPVKPKPAPPPKPVQEIEAFAQAEAIQDIEEIEELITAEEGLDTHTGGAHNTMSTRTMLVDLGKLNLPLMRIPIMPLDTVDNVAKRPNLKDKKMLRSAILARVMLEPPKAIQDSPNEDANHI